MTMSRSGLADTSDMLPHSEAKPARLAVAGTQLAFVALEVGVAVVDDTDVEGVEMHKLLPQFVVVGPIGIVPPTAEPGVFCPHAATPMPPRARAARKRAELDLSHMHSKLSEVSE